MNVRTLNRKLGRNAIATREARGVIRVESSHRLDYRLDENQFKDAGEAAEFLRSKMPSSKLVAAGEA